MIDLNLMSHALAVARHGSFTRAARELGISTPTLSRQIAALEQQLGFRLFDRGRSGAVATPLGKEVLDRTRGLVVDAGLLEQEIASLRGLESGKLSIGAGVYPAYLSLGKTLGRLAAIHPGLLVDARVTDWQEAVHGVMAGDLDLAVVESTGPAADARLAFEALPRHMGIFFCRTGHPILDMAAPTLDAIFEYPFAGTKLAARVVQHLTRPPKAGSIDRLTGDFIPSIRVNSVHLALEAVATSDAFGIAPISAAAGFIEQDRLTTIPFPAPWLHSSYGVVSLRNRTLSPAAVAFIQELRAVEAEFAAAESPHQSPTTRRTRAG